MQDLRVGLIGCGFMGRTHSNAYLRLNNFFSVEHRPVLQAVCGRDRGRTEAFARTWGYGRVETDWRRLIEAKDIDLIDICVPNVAHKEIAVAAAQAGKMVVCEKPLAMNVAEGEAMVRAVKAAGVANMIFFNYRRVPAISLAKQIIEEGRIGRAFHYRATYLQDWTISADVPQGGAALWRLDAADAGSGVTGDLLAHSIDTAMWLNGPVRRVVAKTETFVKERRHAVTGRVQPVVIDDACMFLAEFANGSLGTFEFDPLCARAEELQHVRTQRRRRQRLFRSRGTGISAVLRISRAAVREEGRVASHRMAKDPRHELRAPVHEPLLGARHVHRIRAHVPERGRRFCRWSGIRDAGAAGFRERSADAACVRCRVGERGERALG